MKSILTFEKWTKKMSKNEKPKYSLLTVFFCDDIETLSSQTKLKKNILLLYFFLHIFRKNKKKPIFIYFLRYFKKNILKILII
jgi:hypothetical protein